MSENTQFDATEQAQVKTLEARAEKSFENSAKQGLAAVPMLKSEDLEVNLGDQREVIVNGFQTSLRLKFSESKLKAQRTACIRLGVTLLELLRGYGVNENGPYRWYKQRVRALPLNTGKVLNGSEQFTSR